MRLLNIVLLSAAVMLPSAAFAQSGSDFLMDAARGDNAEIKIGKLAEQKASSPAVKRFGRTLVTDHTMAKKQVAKLATSMSANMPSDVKPDAQQAYDKLSQLSGADFDRAFVNHMVDDHQKDIADFTKEADAHDGKASTLAAKQLPVLKKHLRMAEALQKKEGGSSSMQGASTPQH